MQSKNKMIIYGGISLVSFCVYMKISTDHSNKKLMNEINCLNEEIEKLNLELEIIKTLAIDGNDSIIKGNKMIEKLIKSTDIHYL